ncbi:MAG: hypothetical protein ABIZ72_08490, partial [Candidatus Limnocylindrales bacterium]
MPDDATTTPTFAVPDLELGDGATAYEAAVEHARDERWAERLWNRDPTLWSANERVQAGIADRLGWLDAPAHFGDQVAALEGFGQGIR